MSEIDANAICAKCGEDFISEGPGDIYCRPCFEILQRDIEIDKLKSENEELKSRLAKADIRVDRLKRDVADLAKEHKRLRARVHNLDVVKKLKNKLRVLKECHIVILDAYRVFTQRQFVLKAENERLRGDYLEACKYQAEALTEKNIALAENERLKAKNLELRKRFRALSPEDFDKIDNMEPSQALKDLMSGLWEIVAEKKESE